MSSPEGELPWAMAFSGMDPGRLAPARPLRDCLARVASWMIQGPSDVEIAARTGYTVVGGSGLRTAACP